MKTNLLGTGNKSSSKDSAFSSGTTTFHDGMNAEDFINQAMKLLRRDDHDLEDGEIEGEPSRRSRSTERRRSPNFERSRHEERGHRSGRSPRRDRERFSPSPERRERDRRDFR